MLSRSLAHLSETILCVEDEAMTRTHLVRILQDRFPQVLMARDGQEGLELFRQHRPGLVITDIRMPRRSGIDMARVIRAEAPEVKIIVLTSYGSADLLLAAIEIGVTDYILKPLAHDAVMAKLDNIGASILIERASRH